MTFGRLMAPSRPQEGARGTTLIPSQPRFDGEITKR